MRKSSLILLTTTALLANEINANAHEITKKVYGRANVTIGYSAQLYTNLMNFNSALNVEYKTTHSLSFGSGYNFYYKVNDMLNPFVGGNVEFRIPLTKTVLDRSTYGFNYEVMDVFSMHAKLGTKFNICNEFAVQPYALLGINAMVIKQNTQYRQGGAGFSGGLGVESIIKDLFIVGLEWKASTAIGFQTGHQIGVRFGVQFL